MKKIIIFTMLICLGLLTGCAGNGNATAPDDTGSSVSQEQTQTVLTVAIPKSPAAVPLLRVADSDALGKDVKINFQIYSTMDKMMALASSDDCDVLLIAPNAASTFYNKGINIQLMSVSNWGGMYLSTTDPDCKSWEDLKGKELYVPSKGSVPDLLTQYYIDKNGLKIGGNVEVVYSGHAEIAQLLAAGTIKYAVDAQPFVTANKQKVKNYKVLFDFSEEWKASENGCSMPGFCAVLNGKSQNADLMGKFNQEFSKAIEWTNQNPQEAGELAKKHLNADAKLISEAIPGIHFEYKNAVDAKKDLVQYYNVLLAMKPASVGGQLPDEGFYYVG